MYDSCKRLCNTRGSEMKHSPWLLRLFRRRTGRQTCKRDTKSEIPGESKVRWHRYTCQSEGRWEFTFILTFTPFSPYTIWNIRTQCYFTSLHGVKLIFEYSCCIWQCRHQIKLKSLQDLLKEKCEVSTYQIGNFASSHTLSRYTSRPLRLVEYLGFCSRYCFLPGLHKTSPWPCHFVHLVEVSQVWHSSERHSYATEHPAGLHEERKLCELLDGLISRFNDVFNPI